MPFVESGSYLLGVRLVVHERDIYHVDGLMQERCNSIANALELRVFALTQRCGHYFNDHNEM